jgi:hypothetical protein
MADKSSAAELETRREALLKERDHLHRELGYVMQVDTEEMRPVGKIEGDKADEAIRRVKLKNVDNELARIEASLNTLRAHAAENTTAEASPHPIRAVDGQYVRLGDLVNLRLVGGGEAFSETTRAALVRAAGSPVGETTEGGTIVGPASFLRACLAEAAEGAKPTGNFTLAEAVAGFLIGRRTDDPAFRTQLGDLLPPAGALTGLDGVVADGALTHLLADAATLVEQLTPSQRRIDMRHALLAALRTPEAQRVFFELGVTAPDPAAFFLHLQTTLSGHLGERISADQAAGRPADVFEIVAITVPTLILHPAAAPPGPRRESQVRYVTDAPALTLADDRLGVAEEARALAEVICLRDPGPPLAIGLFGNWGSGKSTFMNMIEAAVEELTGRAQSDPVAGPTLVGKVVHIKFNAWHYNDANLWASLTSEFFSQLRAGGQQARAGADYARLVRDVLKRVAALEGETTGQAAVAIAARKETETLRAEIESLQARQRVEPARVLAEIVPVILTQEARTSAGAVQDALAALGHRVEVPDDKKKEPGAVRKALEEKIEVVHTEIERAVALPGRIAAFSRALLRGATARDWKTTPWLYLALLLGVVFAIALREPDGESVRSTTARVAALLAVTGTAVAALLRIYRLVEPIFRAADEYSTRLRASRMRLDQEIVDKQTRLEEAQKRLSRAEAERAQKTAEAARFRGGTPEQVFDYFLNASTDTQQFERQLGTVSQVRRAFEQLDAIFVERDRLRREVSGSNRGRAEQLAHLEAVAARIDRIVLYIDDLDRCQVHQVVKVLEAVHLLLAFPLFVVVIGVDARWLQRSLLAFYQRQLRDGGATTTSPAPADGGAEHRATVQDYLEKIFQIPIRLEGLSAASGSRFMGYLESVAGPVADPRAGATTVSQPSSMSDTGGGAATIRAIDVRPKPRAETARETVERITLHQTELDTIAALAPFLGKSPRAVKRFLNIYRLLRGLRRGDALDRFLGGAGDAEPARYPGVQFWLALDIGVAPEVVGWYRTVLAGIDAIDGDLQVLASALEDPTLVRALRPNLSLGQAAFAALDSIRSSMDPTNLKACAVAFRALDQRLPGHAGLVALRTAETETARFSLRGP